MKKIIALAAMISASTFAAGAYAQDTGMTKPTPSASDVTFVNITKPPAVGNGNTPTAKFKTVTPDVTQSAQAQIQSDPALMTALQQNSVELNNVVAIETAGNGGKTVYIK